MILQKAGENSSDRIVIIDSLRGFALFGIMISHMSSLFDSFDFSSLTTEGGSIANIVVSSFNGIFISGKFFAIFSFLFGLSFFIQMDRAELKGINYKWRFLWRIVILFAVGFIHSLLFSSDILIIYALLGVFLVFLFKVKDKVLVILIIILLSGVPRFITYGLNHTQSEKTASTENQIMEEKIKEMTQIYQNGSFIDVVRFNYSEGLIFKAKYQLGIEGRAYQTLALFFIGLLIGRKRYFEQIEEKIPLTRKIFKWSILFTFGFIVPALGLFALSDGDMDKIGFQFAMTFYNLANLSFALLITTAFILLYQRNRFRNFLNKLEPYGKMGLTNYMMQSVISVPLFYGFGLSLATHIGLAAGLGIGVVLYILQTIFSKLWLKHFIYGPFEWLWRSATWLKWQKMLKTR